MVAPRAGLVMDPGSKVTYNGVEIGRVGNISETTGRDGKPAAKFSLGGVPEVSRADSAERRCPDQGDHGLRRQIRLVDHAQRRQREQHRQGHLNPSTTIDATAVTTEINTLFQTITSIAEKVDPVKLNLTLSAAAQSLTGLGDRFGQSIVNGNAILDDVNPQMPQARHDIQQLAALGDTYANASPDLFDFLNNAVVTSRTINAQQKDLDQALLSAAGFGNTGADIFKRGGPYLARGSADLVPTAQLLDTYSPELFCTVRNYHDIEPKAGEFLGGNGYSLNDPHRSAVGVGTLAQPGGGGSRGSLAVRRAGRRGRRGTESLHLSGEPAAGERSRRTGGSAGLLAAHHPRSVAGAGVGDGHRQQHRAV